MQLRKRASHRIKNGGRLIQAADLVDSQDLNQYGQGQIVTLTDSDHEFLAWAMVAQQNKGIAWVVSYDRDFVFNQEYIISLVETALKRRHFLFDSAQTNAFRLFNGPGDGLGGLTVDYYAGRLLFTWYNRGLYQYRDEILQAFQEKVKEIRAIFETIRFPLEPGQAPHQQSFGPEGESDFVISENGLQYQISLGQDWMTGIFLDQRDVRQFIQSQAQGLAVLNLFSYTGAFGVAAASGGASMTLNVDLAQRAQEMTQQNYALNNLEFDSQNQVKIMDVFDYIDYSRRHQLRYDLVVCDPPSFSRSKKRTFSALNDYGQLATRLADLVNPGGLLILSTNHSVYQREAFENDVRKALNQVGSFQLIQAFSLGEDFPTTVDFESQYLKVLVYYRAS
ncbi:class I SAM-dependent rRNA methyltransferase [Eremococcus coleocola]|uniref:class I SAM-dependent rRNA methyltransferase n=1 Tax=Eremococcus coleocola TaxID=88132 RepID=UPI0004203104|nr:class I SAM-dependent rRNA methyltransferase [Eremococcus coleocola]